MLCLKIQTENQMQHVFLLVSVVYSYSSAPLVIDRGRDVGSVAAPRRALTIDKFLLAKIY